MNNTVIVKLMTNLIEKKFYNTKDEAVAKLDVYFAMNRISEEEYATLTLLAETTYAEVQTVQTFLQVANMEIRARPSRSYFYA